MNKRRKQTLVLGKDYFYQDGRCVLTRQYLLSMGACCNHDCVQCPYKAIAGECEASAECTGTSAALMTRTTR